ncbi:MAG: hypothetical protein R2823_05990 [Acidimicrobiia bacterium]
MTGAGGAVYDLGYEPYDGERRGRGGARSTIVGDGVRRVLGLRRKARRKIVPWMLIIIAVVPAIVAVGIVFFFPAGASDEFDLATNYGSFYVIGGTIALLFSGLAGPELLIPDRKDGVLSMLSSRPLTSSDYVIAKFASILIVVGFFLLFPQLVLYIGEAGTDTDGILAGLVDAAPKLPRSLAVGAVYALTFVPPAFFVAGLAKRKAVASATFIASMLMLSGIAEGLVRGADFAGNRWFALVAPFDTANAVNLWIFGESDPDSLLTYTGIDPLIGLASIVALAAVFVWLVLRRYQRLM